jgi:predicted trehalose synthase
MGDTSSEEVTFDQIDALARQLFRASDAGGVWEAEDEVTRLHWRKEAVRRLQQARYNEASGSLIAGD